MRPGAMSSAVQRRVEVVDTIDDVLRRRMLECWVETTNAGGAVGFVAPVTAEEVELELSTSVTEVHAGRRQLVVALVDGQLAGFGFLVPNQVALHAHWGTVRALMVHPKRQRLGLGGLLLDRFAELGREQGLRFLTIQYRDGHGLGEFYGKLGYVEVGRLPDAVRIGPDAYVDGVEMMLRL